MDLKSLIGFDWDGGNQRKSDAKHNVSQTEAEAVFFNEPLVVAEDSSHSQTEERYHALGHTNENRLLHIIFTIRGLGTLIRIISARPMSRKERRIYDTAS